MYCWQHIH